MSRVIVYFPRTEAVHYKKDVLQVPLALSSNVVLYGGKTIQINDKRVEQIPAKKKWIDFSFIIFLCLNITKNDVVLFFHVKPQYLLYNLVIKLLRRNARIYLKTDVNEDEFLKYGFYPRIGRLSLRPLSFHKLLFRQVDFVSTESKVVFNHLKQMTTWPKLYYIPNGLPVTEAFLKRCTNNRTVVWSGRICASQKRIDLLMDALISNKFTGWDFKILGRLDISCQDMFFEKLGLAQKINSVMYLGEVNDLEYYREILRSASIQLLTSDYEGFPLVAVESMAYGNYLLSTDVSGVRDLLGQTPILGRILRRENFANELSETLFQIERIYPENIVRYFETNFTWEVLLMELRTDIINGNV